MASVGSMNRDSLKPVTTQITYGSILPAIEPETGAYEVVTLPLPYDGE